MASMKGWDKSEFPVLCEYCLGESPYLRMTNMGFHKECKVCTRPFTTFRWQPGPNERHRKTVLCQSCSKIRNCCQCCALDLQYQLPTGVRDIALPPKDSIPTTKANRDFYMAKVENQVTGDAYKQTEFGKTDSVAKEFLKRMSRGAAEPYQKKQLPNICPDFLKGTCIRGRECPYRHEMVQSIKDFVAPAPGKNIDITSLSVIPTDFNLKKPDEPVIEELKNPKTSLFISGVQGILTEKMLNEEFVKFGLVKSISINRKNKSAVVQFKDTKFAQMAKLHYDGLDGTITLQDIKLKIDWNKSKAPPAPPKRIQDDPLMVPPPPGSAETTLYPSMM